MTLSKIGARKLWYNLRFASSKKVAMPIDLSPHLRTDALLWRYISFTKLVALMSQRSLYFARCDTFDDIFEGSLGRIEDRTSVIGVLDSIADELGKGVGALARQEPSPKRRESRFAERLRSLSRRGSSQVAKLLRRNTPMTITIPDETLDLLRRKMSDGGPDVAGFLKRELTSRFRSEVSRDFASTVISSFISCWHHAPHESEAMWRLYSKDTLEGIAIRATVDSLSRGLPGDRDFILRPVEYRDAYTYKAEDDDVKRFFVKRLSFEHEKEVRVLLTDRAAAERGQKGVLMPVTLDTMLEAIILSPYAPGYLSSVVSDTINKFGCSIPVLESAIRGTPFRS